MTDVAEIVETLRDGSLKDLLDLVEARGYVIVLHDEMPSLTCTWYPKPIGSGPPLGVCLSQMRSIILNETALAAMGVDVIERVLIHECCHALGYDHEQMYQRFPGLL